VALDPPRSSEHLGVFNRELPVDHEAFPRQLFNHVHGVTMDRAVLAEPCVIHEIGHVDDHRIAFPMTNRVTVIRRIEGRVMLAAIRRNDAKSVLFRGVDRVVEENHLIRNLNDFGWRAYARKSLWRALERWVFMTLMTSKIFYFIDYVRLIGRQIGTFQAMLQLGHFIGWLNWALLPALGVVRFSVGAHRSGSDSVTPSCRRP